MGSGAPIDVVDFLIRRGFVGFAPLVSRLSQSQLHVVATTSSTAANRYIGPQYSRPQGRVVARQCDIDVDVEGRHGHQLLLLLHPVYDLCPSSDLCGGLYHTLRDSAAQVPPSLCPKVLSEQPSTTVCTRQRPYAIPGLKELLVSALKSYPQDGSSG